MLELEYLFNYVKEVSKLLRKVPNFDGREFWQPIKNILNDLDIKIDNWKELSQYHKNLINIEQYDKNNKMIEINHFIRQHANIPCNDNPTLTKIVQVALNSGQFLGSATEEEINKYNYNNNKLGEIETYMHKKDIKKISDQISDKTLKDIKKYLDEKLKLLQ
jgi:hypothetical protein